MPDEHAVLWMPEGTLSITRTPTGCHIVLSIGDDVLTGDAQVGDAAEFAAQLERISRG